MSDDNNLKFQEILSKLDAIDARLTPGVWLSVPEAAEYLRLSESSIYKLISNGEIPFKRAGRGEKSKILFNRRELDYWVQFGTTKSSRYQKETAKFYSSTNDENKYDL